MDARVAQLETDMKYMRRDLDEARADISAIKERLGSIDSTLSAINQKMDQFPTKLQLSLWAGGGLVALLAVAVALIAILLRTTGHPEAAAAVDALRGH
jgi:hypothetical protein